MTARRQHPSLRRLHSALARARLGRLALWCGLAWVSMETLSAFSTADAVRLLADTLAVTAFAVMCLSIVAAIVQRVAVGRQARTQTMHARRRTTTTRHATPDGETFTFVHGAARLYVHITGSRTPPLGAREQSRTHTRGPARPRTAAPRPVDPSGFYATLGVAPTASQEEITHAYRARARVAHPDRGGDLATMQQLNRAYQVLKDPTRRRAYERGARV